MAIIHVMERSSSDGGAATAESACCINAEFAKRPTKREKLYACCFGGHE
jgi:hypothetical protein